MSWVGTADGKRRRITAKTPDEFGQALPRNWPHVGRVPLSWTKRYTSKIDEWLESPASLLDKFSLSPQAYRNLRRCRLTASVANKAVSMRRMLAKLEEKTAHSFSITGWDTPGETFWKSLSKQAMATYYEDSVLHSTGRKRMEEWWQQNGSASTDTGCALTFWYALDDSTAELSLPDEITA